MTEKQLSKYYYLKKEVEDIENRLREFGDGVGAIQYSDSPKAPSSSHLSIQEKKAQLYDMYMEKRISALEEYIKIEQFIMNVDDPEISLIMRKRFIDLKSWEVIGNELFGDRTTAPKKMRRYLKSVSHNSQ